MNLPDRLKQSVNRFENDYSENDLSNITNDDVRKKAFRIYSKYIYIHLHPETGQWTGDWEQVASAVCKLKLIMGMENIENEDFAQLRPRMQARLEATIMAFDIQKGAFPENFNIKTGKFK